MPRIFSNINFVLNSSRGIFKSCVKNVIKPRECSKIAKSEDFELEPFSTTYEDTSSEYGTGKKYAIAKLQDLLKLRLYAATNIATRYKILQQITGKTLSDNYQLLVQEGVNDALILEYPDILAQKDMQDIIRLLNELPFAITETLPLLKPNFTQCKLLLHKQINECIETPGGRIGFYSRLLELPVIQVCDVLTKRPFLCTISLEKVTKNHKTLLDYGIPNNDIIRDFWVLQYNTDVINERLGFAKDVNVDKIKTWMVRANALIFSTYLKRRNENKLILGDNSLLEYLAERLECSIDQCKIILSKHPPLATKSMKKLKEVIDSLYNEGYTPVHIVRNPKILLHSAETTRKRLKELEALGMKVTTLHILTKSQKQYMHYYENLVKSTKNKVKENT